MPEPSTETSPTTPSTPLPPGINAEGVTDWFCQHVAEAAPPLGFELVPSGHSNLTYIVTDSEGQRFVLRRPPLQQVLATAHDMSREHRIISALYPTAVPVPRPLGFCDDETVNERPFYVMAFVEGMVLRDPDQTSSITPDIRMQTSKSIARTLAELHKVDIAEVGLDTLAKQEDYIARQLRRWMGQFEQSQTTDRPAMAKIHAHLSSRIPPQTQTGIVHGDYRLDNCMVSPDGGVAAVLDWELCTLGDVLADVATLLMYWSETEDEFTMLETSATQAPGFASRAEMLAEYEAASGRELPQIDFYMAFATWRLACILEGVYSRYLGGAMGTKELPGGPENFKTQFNARIEALVARAAEYAAAV